MTNYVIRDGREPLVEDIAAVKGGDSDSSDGIFELLQATNPRRIADAGRAYLEVAEMCRNSVETLYGQAQRIAEYLGGEPLEGVFKKIGELQDDLARVDWTAQSVGKPLVTYGEQVLPWFRDNVPRTGEAALDDWVGEQFGTDTNAHTLARHHLQQLNRFMGQVYGALPAEMAQRATAPSGAGGTSPNIPGMTGLGTPDLGRVGDPYTGAGLSPYDPSGLDGPRTPGLGDPSGLSSPGTSDPSLQLPGTNQPKLPDVQNPNLQNPDLKTPDLKTPDLQNPDLKTPGLPQPDTRADLSGLPNTNLTNPLHTSVPTTGGPQSPVGSATAAQGITGSLGGAGIRAGANGMPMGMMPPMTGAGGSGQDQDRERTRYPLVEDEVFETDDLGGPAVIA
ncbi:hypothetical protein ABT294_02535 [Nonomuraea sp. NPDC000554]|uniref:hypothetical protein n=1 Tax=Nonomuraea sp. NPDC000554 TaxID=3154259 RepID=UPI0033258EF8